MVFSTLILAFMRDIMKKAEQNDVTRMSKTLFDKDRNTLELSVLLIFSLIDIIFTAIIFLT